MRLRTSQQQASDKAIKNNSLFNRTIKTVFIFVHMCMNVPHYKKKFTIWLTWGLLNAVRTEFLKEIHHSCPQISSQASGDTFHSHWLEYRPAALHHFCLNLEEIENERPRNADPAILSHYLITKCFAWD